MKISWPSRYGSFISLAKHEQWHFAVMWNGRYRRIFPRGSTAWDNIWRQTGERLPR